MCTLYTPHRMKYRHTFSAIIQNEKILLHSFVGSFIHSVNINPKWLLKLPRREYIQQKYPPLLPHSIRMARSLSATIIWFL